MNIKFILAGSNIEYHEHSQDRPSFTDCKGNDLFADGYKAHFNSTKEVIGNFTRHNFMDAELTYRYDTQGDMEKIRAINYLTIRLTDDKGSYNIQTFGHISKAVDAGEMTFKFILKLDVGATYGRSIVLNPDRSAMVKRTHESRFKPARKYNKAFTLHRGGDNDDLSNKGFFSFNNYTYFTIHNMFLTRVNLNDKNPLSVFYSNGFIKMYDTDGDDVDTLGFTGIKAMDPQQPTTGSKMSYIYKNPQNHYDSDANIGRVIGKNGSDFNDFGGGIDLSFNDPLSDDGEDGAPGILTTKGVEGHGTGIDFNVNNFPLFAVRNDDDSVVQTFNKFTIKCGGIGYVDPVSQEGGYTSPPFTINGDLDDIKKKPGFEKATYELHNGIIYIFSNSKHTFQEFLPQQIQNHGPIYFKSMCNVGGGDSNNGQVDLGTESANTDKTYDMDFIESKGMGFDDVEVSHFKAQESYDPDKGGLPVPVVQYATNTFWETIKYSRSGWGMMVGAGYFLYAIGTPAGGDGSEMPDAGDFFGGNSAYSMPYLLTPLYDGNLQKTLTAGNDMIGGIVITKFPLIKANNMDEGLITDKVSTFYNNKDIPAGMDGNGPMVAAEQIADNMPTGRYNFPIGLQYFTINQPDGTENGDMTRELKLYTSPHFIGELTQAHMKREMFPEQLLGIENFYSSYKTLRIDAFEMLNGLTVMRKGIIKNGYYGRTRSLDKAGYLIDNMGGLPSTSSAYTKFMQDHLNTYNTSKGAMKGDFITGRAENLLDKTASVEKGNGSLGAALGATMSYGASQIGIKWQYDKGMAQLNSKIKDLERNPETIKGVSNSDNISLAFAQAVGSANQTNSEIIPKGYANPIIVVPELQIRALELNPQEKRSVALHYHYNGYIVNEMRSFNRVQDFAKVRTRYNYGEISNFSYLLMYEDSPLGSEALSWFNDLFDKGVRLGNSIDGKKQPVSMYSFGKENGESDMFE